MMTTSPAKPAVHALLTFLASRNDNGAAIYIPSVAGAGSVDAAEGVHAPVSVPVYNARTAFPWPTTPTLDVQGFQLVTSRQQQQQQPDDDDDDDDDAAMDYYDDEQVQSKHHAAVRKLVFDKVPGAVRVEIFDDTRRSSSAAIRASRKLREPSANVHNDYTPASGLRRLRHYWEHSRKKTAQHSNDDDDESLEEVLQQHPHWCIINVWRSIGNGPVLNYPMVLCDATTVDPDDLMAVERKSATRTGEIQMAVYNARQRWYYFPQMQRNEVLLFQTFDSIKPSKTIHSSFDDPTAPANAPPRESIETRCFVFF